MKYFVMFLAGLAALSTFGGIAAIGSHLPPAPPIVIVGLGVVSACTTVVTCFLLRPL